MALTAVTATTAVAQKPLDSRTEFTFNTPTEMPGVTLPPGTYVFRFVDATTSKNVMQVAAKDQGMKTYGLFNTISAQRPKASDDAELRFMETPAGKPTAVKTWWYPGETIGREFIYPKDQARRLAKATNEPVLTTKEEKVSTSAMGSADLTYVEPNGQEMAAPAQSRSSASSSSANANMDRTPVQTGTSASNSSRRSLPHTSGDLPLMVLMGLSSLAGGVSLRFRR